MKISKDTNNLQETQGFLGPSVLPVLFSTGAGRTFTFEENDSIVMASTRSDILRVTESRLEDHFQAKRIQREIDTVREAQKKRGMEVVTIDD